MFSCSQHTCLPACESTNEQICKFNSGKCLVDRNPTNKPKQIRLTEAHQKCPVIISPKGGKDPEPSIIEEPDKGPGKEPEPSTKVTPTSSSVNTYIATLTDPSPEPQSAHFLETFGLSDVIKITAGVVLGALFGALITYFVIRKRRSKRTPNTSNKRSRMNSEKSVRFYTIYRILFG